MIDDTNTGLTSPKAGKNKSTAPLELVLIFVLGFIVYVIAGHYDVLEEIVSFSHEHEQFEIDEIITASAVLLFGLAIFYFRRWREAIDLMNTLDQEKHKLEQAFEEIKQLRGMIPICASCKNIRDDKRYWHQVESYISDRSEAVFTHSICPECMKKLYPELIFRVDKQT